MLTPDLLNPQWRSLRTPDDHSTAGHCYAAAEATWWLTGRTLKPKVANLGKDSKGRDMTHWWLEKPDGSKVDPTAAQFSPDELKKAYSNGKDGNFGLGWRKDASGKTVQAPSSRAKIIMDRVGKKG